MSHTFNLENTWTSEDIRETRMYRLKRDFFGAILLLFCSCVVFCCYGVSLELTASSSILLLLYIFGLKLLKDGFYNIPFFIYFITPVFLFNLIGFNVEALRYEGLLYLPMAIDLFNYKSNRREIFAYLALYLLSVIFCFYFDFSSSIPFEALPFSYQISSLLVVVISVGFAAANMQNVFNSPLNFIKKLVKADQAITSHKAKFEQIFLNTVEGIIVCNYKEGIILSGNPAFDKMTGNDKKEPKLSSFFSEYDFDLLEKSIYNVVVNQESTNIDISLLGNLNGVEITKNVECTVIPYDIHDDLIAISFHDISDRIQAFKAKAESEALYKSLLQTSSAGIIHCDLNGKIKYASTSAFSILGLEYGTLIGTQVTKIFEEYLEDKILSSIPKIMKGLEANGIFKLPHFKINSQRSGERHLEGSISFLRDGEKKIAGYLFVYNDITLLMDSQSRMLENGLIFQSLLSNSFDGIDVIEMLQTDVQHELKGRLILRNDNMLKIVNDPDKTYLSFDEYCSLIKIENQKQLTRAYEKFVTFLNTLSNQKSVRIVNRFYVDNIEKLIHCTYQLIEVNEKQFLIRVFKDITKQKEQETLLVKKNTELKNYIESNVSLANFASIASHDLKSPLRTIHSFAQLLKRREAETLSPSGHDYLKMILDSSGHLGMMVDDILNFSRVNTNDLKFDSVDSYKLVCSILSELKTDIKEKKCVINIEEMPNVIVCDSIKISQVFSNLIRNAMKFREKDRESIINIGCDEHADKWNFYVQDNGIGISKENRESIFKLFGRLHSHQEYEGSGIGLAICAKIIKAHNGQITVDSEPGVGSTFKFSIDKSLAPAVILE